METSGGQVGVGCYEDVLSEGARSGTKRLSCDDDSLSNLAKNFTGQDRQPKRNKQKNIDSAGSDNDG